MIDILAAPVVELVFGSSQLAQLCADPPQQVQCYGCGGMIDSGTVYLSAVRALPLLHITAWSHPACGRSRVFTAEEFEAFHSRVPAAPPGSEEPPRILLE